MALVVKDRVREVSTTTGTADFLLGGSSSGFQTFSVIGDGNTTYYAAVDQATGAWEVGIGTYSSTGPTLSRDTILESSNANSKVSFAAGSKDVFCTYPAERSVYLDIAGSAVTALDIGTLGASTANITSANITAGTVSTTPANNTDLVNKQYVDSIAVQGTYYHSPVKYETASALTATYNNGSSGVGATLTNAGTLAAFAPDGVIASVGDRILVYRQADQTQNGIYTVTTVGSGSVAWVLTRATDANSYGLTNPNALGQGDAFFVTSGNTGSGETYVCNTVGTIVFGTTNITFVQVSDTQVYSAGTGLTLSGTQFSITPVGTAATYGSASQVPVFTTNASGQVSSVTNTAIAISSGAVSGLAASATTDTTNATNITSGTLPAARLSGSYTGVTGVGTLTAGTWNATAIAANYGGTGQTSYAVGDLLYASTTTALSKLADVATGNALISGGVGVAPSWGKVGLTTHVSGTLAVANGGTGATTLTGYVYGNGTGAFTASTSIPNSATTATSANTASAIVARDASGNFSAGTITASLSGNATTATSAGAVSVHSTNEVNIGGSYAGGGTLYVNYNDGGSYTNISFYNGGTSLSQVTASQFNGSLNGDAATVDGKSFGTFTAAGGILYATSTTAASATAAGTSGQVLTSGAAGAPTWTNQASIAAGSADTVAIAADTTSTGTFYVPYASATTGDVALRGTRLTVQPSTGNFTAAGNVTAYSDERLKADWAALPEDFIDRLAQVKFGTYTRTDTGERQAGTSAQDWQTLLPEVVGTHEDGFLHLAYGNAALVAALALAQRVTAQDAKIAQLEAVVAELVKDRS